MTLHVYIHFIWAPIKTIDPGYERLCSGNRDLQLLNPPYKNSYENKHFLKAPLF